MVGAADDVSDSKVEVVGDHAEVICRVPVRAHQDKVFDFGVEERHAAENLIVESRLACLRHAEPQRGRAARGSKARALSLRQIAARPVVFPGSPLGLGRRPPLLEFIGSAETGISVAALFQARAKLAVTSQAF